MTLKTQLAEGFAKIINKAGRPIDIRYYNMTVGSVWDDEVTLSEVTGSRLWTSGVVLPLNSSTDSLLVEQGKLQNHDQRLYIAGTTNLTGSDFKVKVTLGSNAGDSYNIIPEGTITAEVEATKIYRKVFIRRLTTGSLTPA